ncbi:MAG: HlyD family efflux transporter periplasmic adaptor subunit [Pegethrix bostrychoides GSE-TBD4-15B]|jgi:HlyD family secretion protein|uniref:HlyD family efflux transporter periplasmic adaptor subunit n=1 Tax=Pegethrix bostrychoides GSE-TBD4-15B TaxID=2839662 RepID=A0A951U2T3_9CYAN|nr:HlyD family efflux transporter periplasmic adaptor subunit [Pegethrix bostrychoides GSE-TBD4-15B]
MAISKKNFRSGWAVAALATFLALGAAGLGLIRLLSRSPAPAETAETAALPQRVEVVALGRIEPQSEVVRVGGPSGERIQRLQVKQGDIVKAGDLLAYLESYGERKAERDYAASQLNEAERSLQATTAYGQSQIQEAQTRVQQVAAPSAAEIAAQQANIRELAADLELANQDLQRFEELYAQGALAKQDLDRQISAARQAQEKLNSARANLTRIQTRQQTEIKNAEAQLQVERANLPLSQTQVTAESARQNLQLAQAKLDRTVIRAPRDGRILKIITKAGEAIGEDGILDLGDTRQMVAVAEVYETDVSRIKLGQSATVASRNGAFEQPLTGKVSEIGWQIFKNNVLDDDPAANADSRVVEVKVKLDDSQSVAALTNLQVDVRIDVAN